MEAEWSLIVARIKSTSPFNSASIKDFEFAIADCETDSHSIVAKLAIGGGYVATGRKYDRTVAWPRDLESFRRLLLPLQEEATELGVSGLSEDLIDEICRVLAALYNERTGNYPMYMMQDGSVAIDIRGPRPDGILVRIKPDMTVHCSGENAGQMWRQPYPNLSDFPDTRFFRRLAALGTAGNPL